MSITIIRKFIYINIYFSTKTTIKRGIYLINYKHSFLLFSFNTFVLCNFTTTFKNNYLIIIYTIYTLYIYYIYNVYPS